MIPSYEKSVIKSIVKMPKGVLRDSGFANYIAGIDSKEKLLRDQYAGQKFEAFVIEELIKGIQATNVRRWDYYYYRTKSGIEVDLILCGKFGVIPIEIKFGITTSIKELKSLNNFLKQENLPLGIVINNDDSVKLISDKIIQIPVSYI